MLRHAKVFYRLMKSSIILICNPAAKGMSKGKIEQACRLLEQKDYDVELLFTKQRGEAGQLAEDAVKRAPSVIIAAGGDGTFNEVANGIAGSEIPMAILPLGTTNVLAKELGIPDSVEGALAVALNNKPKSVSLGRIAIVRDASPVSRYFILMAGVGFDGKTVYGINETFKKISGKGAYLFSGVKTLLRFDPDELAVTVDGKTYTAYSLIVGNASKYGGHFRVTPDVRLIDPILHVCLFKRKKRIDTFRYVLGIVTGSHLRFADVEYLKATQIQVKGHAHIQIDGDYFGMTPAEISVVPNALRLVF
jgi:diacylglycerol kinase (ATP)